MRHTENFEVRFYEADRNSRLTPVSLFNYLQETAIRHGDVTGVDSQRLETLGYAWMMNRLHLQVHRYPSRLERISVETWGSCLQGHFAIREWRTKDAQGCVVALATGRWVIIDVRKKRIIRIPTVMLEAYGEHEERAIPDDFDRMETIENGSNLRQFHVRSSELDTNQHANSASYVDWCLEAVPAEVLDGYSPVDFEITFKKEAKLGDELSSTSTETQASEAGSRRFIHRLGRAADGALNAIAASVWRRAE